jgi:hypothetical protein
MPAAWKFDLDPAAAIANSRMKCLKFAIVIVWDIDEVKRGLQSARCEHDEEGELTGSA